MFIYMKKSTSSLTSFLRYCKDIVKNFDFAISGNLGMPYHTPKMIIRIWKNILSAGKKSSSSFTFSLSYFFIAKILWSCFGYLGHARLCKPNVILSIYRKLSCLSAGKKSTLSSMRFWRLTVSILTHNLRTILDYF